MEPVRYSKSQLKKMYLKVLYECKHGKMQGYSWGVDSIVPSWMNEYFNVSLSKDEIQRTIQGVEKLRADGYLMRDATQLSDNFLILTDKGINAVKEQGEPLPTSKYELSNLHPRIRGASEQLFMDGYYSQAIFEAYKILNIAVKEKSGKQNLDGQNLMSTVFNTKNPILKLNDLQDQSDLDEQEGFMFLFMGAMTGIRNPKAHDVVNQKDPIRTLEYLALASLLVRRAEESNLS
jgi:uncharacterized protein (TIGR02391 family)